MAATVTPIKINGSDVPLAKTLTTAESTYLSQLAASGVDLTTFLLSGTGIGKNPLYTYPVCVYNGTVEPSSCFGNAMIDSAKAYYVSKNIDFATLLTQKLQSIGINVASNGDTTVIKPDTPFSTLSAAVSASIASGTGIPTAFTNMANSFDFGYIAAQILNFIGDSNNSGALQQAVQMMNYPVPLTSDINGQNQFEQIYWAGFYLVQYPLKNSYSTSDCQMILEAIKALTAEKANIASQIASNFYSLYTQDDYEIKSTVLTDIISNYNILDAKYNCTANASQQISQQANSQLQSQLQTSIAGASPVNNTLFYIICAGCLLVCSVVVYRRVKTGRFTNKQTTQTKKTANEPVIA